MIYIILISLLCISLGGFIATMAYAYIIDYKTSMQISTIASSLKKMNAMTSTFRLSFEYSAKKIKTDGL